MENGCTLFVGSVVVGANSVVNKSISEPNTTVAGAPAKKVAAKGSATWPENNYDL